MARRNKDLGMFYALDSIEPPVGVLNHVLPGWGPVGDIADSPQKRDAPRQEARHRRTIAIRVAQLRYNNAPRLSKSWR